MKLPGVAPEWRTPLGGKRTRVFDPGPPSSPRRLNFYGHFRRKEAAKRFWCALNGHLWVVMELEPSRQCRRCLLKQELELL